MIVVYFLISLFSFLLFREANRIYNGRYAHRLIPVFVAIFLSFIPLMNILFSISFFLFAYSKTDNNKIKQFFNWFEGP